MKCVLHRVTICMMGKLFHHIPLSSHAWLGVYNNGKALLWRRFIFEVMVNHIYFTFYNKISAIGLDQWLPLHVDTCCQSIHRALSNGTIYKTTM